MLEQLLSWLKLMATTGSLEVFVFIGSILEELIGPIPAPLVMSLAGFIANQRGATWWYLVVLAVIGAVGKTVASVLLYYLGDKAEDLIVGRWGKFLGLSHQKLEQVSLVLSKGWWDDAILVFLRAVPLIPTFIVSLGCGVLKLPLRSFIWTTMIGSVMRNLMMIWLGIFATAYVQKFWDNGGAEMARRPLFLSSAAIGLVIGGLIALLIKRKLQTSSKTQEVKPE